MSFMTEKRAHELLDEYMKAELKADRTDAVDIEGQLNKAGWFITSQGGEYTVKRNQSGSNLPKIDDFYLPKETTIQPYTGDEPKSNKTLWITLSIIASLIAITVLVVYILKKRKNGRLSKFA